MAIEIPKIVKNFFYNNTLLVVIGNHKLFF